MCERSGLNRQTRRNREKKEREGKKETRRKGASEGGRDIVTPLLTSDQPPIYTIHIYIYMYYLTPPPPCNPTSWRWIKENQHR